MLPAKIEQILKLNEKIFGDYFMYNTPEKGKDLMFNEKYYSLKGKITWKSHFLDILEILQGQEYFNKNNGPPKFDFSIDCKNDIKQLIISPMEASNINSMFIDYCGEVEENGTIEWYYHAKGREMLEKFMYSIEENIFVTKKEIDLDKYKIRNRLYLVYKNNKIEFDGVTYEIETPQEKQDLFYIIYLRVCKKKPMEKNKLLKLIK